MNIRANIEAIRKQQHKKQLVVAERLGISQGTYSGYITQNKDISFGKILDIANVLNVPVIDIVTYPEKYIPQTDKCEEGKEDVCREYKDRECRECKEKERIIRNLNDYIDELQKKLNQQVRKN